MDEREHVQGEEHREHEVTPSGGAELVHAASVIDWTRSAFVATPGNVPLDVVPSFIETLWVPVAWGTMPTPVDPAWLAKARERFDVYAWAWCAAADIEGEARVHAQAAADYPAFSANMEEPYDAHGDASNPKMGYPSRYLAAFDYAGALALTTTPRFASHLGEWAARGALYSPQAFPLETGVGLTECVTFARDTLGYPIELIRPLVQSYPTNGYRPNPEQMNAEAAALGVGGIPYTIEQACDTEGVAWLNTMQPTIERAQPEPENGGGNVSPDVPHWSEKGYPGGPMVKVKGFPRPMYPPDAAAKGKTPSKDGPDVLAYKRTVSRAGRWPWQTFDDTYSDNFSHGKTEAVIDSGVAGVQRQQKIDATGWIGETTFNTLRSIRIPEGLPHAGEPAMDATAVNLINEAFDAYKGGGRQAALDHLARRVGYTEQPDGSNCDNRSDGIRTAQTRTASGGDWLHYEPWCGCWCYYALEAGNVAKIDSHLASVAQIEDFARAGQKCYRGWTTDRSRVKPGDLVIVGGYGVHVETVRATPNPDGSVPTYGGNTSPGTSGSQSNGGGAYSRVRAPSEVRGFALVRYPGE